MEEMRTVKLTIEYDGTEYCGWQIQPNGITIQEKLEDAIQKLTGTFCRVHGSGRTDRGVHALGQVAHFHTDSEISGNDFARAINAYLPKDISVRESLEVNSGFHSRFSALEKHYCYIIENAKTRPVLDRHKVWWISWDLDFELIKEATSVIVGTHDFTSFTDAERKDEDNTRNVISAEWKNENNRLTFNIQGEGFLYKMVRCLVGTIIEAGRGKISKKEMLDILDAKDRTKAGPTAPPCGLHLKKVIYPEKFNVNNK
jgi:tRNA pseudouridine38-40 synthase